MSTEPMVPKGQEIAEILLAMEENGVTTTEAETKIREIIALEIEDAIIRATLVDTTTPEIGMFVENIADVSTVQAYLGAANVVRGRVPLTEEQALAQSEETTLRREAMLQELVSRADAADWSGLEPTPVPVVMTPELMATAADGAVMYDFEGEEMRKVDGRWAYVSYLEIEGVDDPFPGVKTPSIHSPYTSAPLPSYPEKEA